MMLFYFMLGIFAKLNIRFLLFIYDLLKIAFSKEIWILNLRRFTLEFGSQRVPTALYYK